MNEKNLENTEEIQPEPRNEKDEKITPDIYSTREIEIEEVAIDGICGVY